MTFPSSELPYLEILRDRCAEKSRTMDIFDQLKAYSGMELNWIGDFLTDEQIEWKKTEIAIDDLYLTGIDPTWNIYIKELAHGSPMVMRSLIETHSALKKLIECIPADSLPILVRYEGESAKVLDGMHRVLRALLEKKSSIQAYVGHSTGDPRPHCEAHVVYDIIRAYQRGLNKDTAGCVAALRFLYNSYGNVGELLQTRFSYEWLRDPEIEDIIKQVLKQ